MVILEQRSVEDLGEKGKYSSQILQWEGWDLIKIVKSV